MEEAQGGRAGRRWHEQGASDMSQRFSRSCMNMKEAGEGQGPRHEARGAPSHQCPAHPTGHCFPVPKAVHKQEQKTNTPSPQDLEGKASVNLILFIFFSSWSRGCNSLVRANGAEISSVRRLPSWQGGTSEPCHDTLGVAKSLSWRSPMLGPASCGGGDLRVCWWPVVPPPGSAQHQHHPQLL